MPTSKPEGSRLPSPYPAQASESLQLCTYLATPGRKLSKPLIRGGWPCSESCDCFSAASGWNVLPSRSPALLHPASLSEGKFRTLPPAFPPDGVEKATPSEYRGHIQWFSGPHLCLQASW